MQCGKEAQQHTDSHPSQEVGEALSEEVVKEKLLGAVMPDAPGAIPHGLTRP